MTPHEDDQLEVQFRRALDVGDPEAIGTLAREIDQRDRAREAVPLIAAALWYAEQGLKVFPLQARSKVPHKGTRGCKDASSDPAQVRAWWEARPDSNIGIATGHIVDVIDVDGPAGVKSFASHVEEVRAIALGMVSTPRPGGQHWYIPRVAGRGNKAGLLHGVDTRGAGGYVVAPPSVTDIGSYRWIHPLNLPGGAA